MSDHPQPENPLDTPVQYVKGVGPRRALLFEKLNIRTVGDLLYFVPRRYEDRRAFTSIGALKSGDVASVEAVVQSNKWVRPRYGKGYCEVCVTDGSGLLVCRWFNATYLRDILTEGATVIFHGKVNRQKSKWLMMHPEFEVQQEGEEDPSVHLRRVAPVYGLTEDLPQRTLRRIMWYVVERYADVPVDPMPAWLRAQGPWPNISEALRQVHFPETLEQGCRARDRLVLDEFLAAQLLVARRRRSLRSSPACEIPVPGELAQAYGDTLGFEMTGDQKQALADIRADLCSGFPMNRMLQGDVGCGKTVVAFLAMLDVIAAGKQASIMVPTEVLARQHFDTMSRFLNERQIQSALLTGDVSAADRKNIASGLKSGRIQLVVGTHALFYDQVEFNELALAIVDEQHKFGVAQRGRYMNKGLRPHVLVMSATPIPRTLAMTIYGDLDVSTIREMPSNRKEVVTRLIDRDKLPLAYDFIRKQVAKGRQAYLIYPLVEESDKLDLEAATTMFEKLRASHFMNERIGLVHGKMKAEQKQQTMRAFKDGSLDILVSTTVVEVGVDVPNATVMLIGNAERFGLAQLHQLRGRIGRGEHKSFCILQGEAKSKDSWRRLSIMEGTRDGFVIAEEDLNIRGMGNLLGTEQSGFPALRVGNPMADGPLLLEARNIAFRIVEEDPAGTNPDYAALYLVSDRLAKEIGSLVQVG